MAQMIEPFFFGPRERPLFGIYHPPQTRSDRDAGIVLCNPLGREYLYTHRALRQLAQRLAESGFHVLRFDYSGTGDSAGECEEADAAQWMRDTVAAISEVRDRAGADRVSVVGLRLGASIAVHAASGRRDVEGLVLWEPLPSMAAYLDELNAAHRKWMAGMDSVPGAPAADGSVECLGFNLSQRFRDSLVALDSPAGGLKKPARRALIVRQGESNGDLAGELTRVGTKAEEVTKPAPRAWLGRGADGRVIVPAEVLQTIVAWLEQEA